MKKESDMDVKAERVARGHASSTSADISRNSYSKLENTINYNLKTHRK